MEDIDLDEPGMHDITLAEDSEDDSQNRQSPQEFNSASAFTTFDSSFDPRGLGNGRGTSSASRVGSSCEGGDLPIDMDTPWWKTPLDQQQEEQEVVQAQQNSRAAPLDASIFGLKAVPSSPPITSKNTAKTSQSKAERPKAEPQKASPSKPVPSMSPIIRKGSILDKNRRPHWTDHIDRDNGKGHTEAEGKTNALSTESTTSDEKAESPVSIGLSFSPRPSPLSLVDDEVQGEMASLSEHGEALVGKHFAVTLERGDMGLGIVLDHSGSAREQMVWVDNVVDGSPAALSRLQIGDVLIKVNGHDVCNNEINVVVKQLTTEVVRLMCYRPENRMGSVCEGVFDARSLAPPSPLMAVKTRSSPQMTSANSSAAFRQPGSGAGAGSKGDDQNEIEGQRFRSPAVNKETAGGAISRRRGSGEAFLSRMGSSVSHLALSPFSSSMRSMGIGRQSSNLSPFSSADAFSVPDGWEGAVGTWKQCRRTADGAERMLSLSDSGALQLMVAKFPSREVTDGQVLRWNVDKSIRSPKSKGNMTPQRSAPLEDETATLIVRSRRKFLGTPRRWHITLHHPLSDTDAGGLDVFHMKVDGVDFIKTGEPKSFHRPQKTTSFF